MMFCFFAWDHVSVYYEFGILWQRINNSCPQVSYPSSPSHCACNALLVARPVPEAMRYLVDVLANLPVGPISWWHTTAAC